MDAPWLSCCPPHNSPSKKEQDAVELFDCGHVSTCLSTLSVWLPAEASAAPDQAPQGV